MEELESSKGVSKSVSNLGSVSFGSREGSFGDSLVPGEVSTDRCIGGGVGMMKT